MRITTWNINSVRLRLPLALKLLEEVQPDVLCLQETKATPDQFPAKAFAEAGYPHQIVQGMKGYNGVAIVSRVPIEDSGSRDWCGKPDARHAAGRTADGIEVHCFYVPSGGDVPDPSKNEKFKHKLDFLAEMRDWFGKERKPSDPMVLVGDLNIAPLENDVWSHKQLLDVVSHTPVEVDAMEAFRSGLDWVDSTRHFTPEPERLYSWWSYRSRDWSASDRGRRLDHVWVTQPLKSRLVASTILRDARGWEKPSDHVPVTTDIS